MMTDHTAADADQRRELVVGKLAACGITPTPQRVEIGIIVLLEPQHLSAEQVLAAVNERDPVVSKATVYNTLGLFAAKGLVRELVIDSTKVFYDSNVSDHYHLYRVDTGQVEDLAQDAVRLATLPELAPGLSVEGVDIIIRVRGSGRGD